MPCPPCPSNSEMTASAPRLPIRARSRVRCEDVGDGSAAEDGGTHRFDGERCGEEQLARAQNDGMDNRRYSSINPVSTSDRANRVPPWASRYPPERSCLSRVMASARSPAAIVVLPQSADLSEFENTTFGISFI